MHIFNSTINPNLFSKKAVDGQALLQSIHGVDGVSQQLVEFPGGHVTVHAGGKVGAFRQPQTAHLPGKGAVNIQCQRVGGQIVKIVGIHRYGPFQLFLGGGKARLQGAVAPRKGSRCDLPDAANAKGEDQSLQPRALGALDARLGISMDHVYCIGDETNDISMIEVSKEGFAPANCAQAVRDCGATIVADKNHDALADVIAILDRYY